MCAFLLLLLLAVDVVAVGVVVVIFSGPHRLNDIYYEAAEVGISATGHEKIYKIALA